jgi:hypothetical protein
MDMYDDGWCGAGVWYRHAVFGVSYDGAAMPGGYCVLLQHRKSGAPRERYAESLSCTGHAVSPRPSRKSACDSLTKNSGIR